MAGGSRPARRRLDNELVRRGLAASRAAAQALLADGVVRVNGAPASKPAHQVSPADAVVVAGPPPRFVSRGGEKLDAALDAFAVDVAGRRVLDAGASTGGFTDCLLQRGAAAVVALDVGRAQLHERIAGDPRVERRDRTNVRHVVPTDLGGAFELAVADLSFISLRTVMGALLGLLVPAGVLVALVKPQFEVGRAEADRGRGVIRDPSAWQGALDGVIATAEGLGATIMGGMVSPLRGGDGNVEFLLALRAPASTASDAAPAVTVRDPALPATPTLSADLASLAERGGG